MTLQRSQRPGAFRFIFALMMIIWVSITITDIYMVRVVWRTGESTTPPIPEMGGTPIEPYHFWGLWLPYATMSFVLGASYFYMTREPVGTIIIFMMSFGFMAFLISDTSYFFLQGQNVPDTFTWLYPPHGSSVTGERVLKLSAIGVFAIALLYFWYSGKAKTFTAIK